MPSPDSTVDTRAKPATPHAIASLVSVIGHRATAFSKRLSTLVQTPQAQRGARLALHALFAVLTACAVAPIFTSAWIPFQDLPQHEATLAVMASLHDPQLRFAEYFRVELFSTQYLGYYLAVLALAKVVGVEFANRLFIAAVIGGTPWTLRFMLRRLGRPEHYALIGFVLAYNRFTVLGFMNFIAALPLAFLAIGLSVTLAQTKQARWGVVVMLTLFAGFLMHPLPFGAGGLACAAVTLRLGDWKGTLRSWLFLAPPAIAAGLWVLNTDAGSDVAALQQNADELARRAADLPAWILDVWRHDDSDIRLFVLTGIGTLAAFVLRARDALAPRAVGVAVVGLAMLWAYFVAPMQAGWIWPIAPRFALVGLLMLLVTLPRTPRLATALLCVYFGALGATALGENAQRMAAFNEVEVADFDEAVAEIPLGSRVMGLMFEPWSERWNSAAFLHGASRVQAVRGGLAMFSFADFPQSPIRLREGARPPEVPPRWEWTPESVDLQTETLWYDYVIVRRPPARFAQHAPLDPVFEGEAWSVYSVRHPQ